MVTLRDGLGESAAFYRSHPLLNFSWFAFVIGVTMFSMHPAFLLASFGMAWVYSLLLRGKKAVKLNLLVLMPVIVLMTLFNTLNVHNGVTVLFYLNDNRITLEAITYGLAAAVMLSSVMIWFSCFNVIVTADKFIYLFGRVAPVHGYAVYSAAAEPVSGDRRRTALHGAGHCGQFLDSAGAHFRQGIVDPHRLVAGGLH